MALFFWFVLLLVGYGETVVRVACGNWLCLGVWVLVCVLNLFGLGACLRLCLPVWGLRFLFDFSVLTCALVIHDYLWLLCLFVDFVCLRLLCICFCDYCDSVLLFVFVNCM